jgi:parallel beta-helix repeat protein
MRKIKVLLLALFLLASVLAAADWYVRPAGGNYGLENGTSYANAWDGLLNVKWGAGGVQPGDTLWVCGLHVYEMTNPANIAEQANIKPTSGTSESARVTIRGDYPGDAGIIWGAYKISYNSWTQQTSPNSSVWAIYTDGACYQDWFFADITAGSWTVLDKVTSVADCQTANNSFYYDSANKDLYVNHNGADPTGHIYCNRWGYHWLLSGKQYITFKNLKIYCHYRFLESNQSCSYITWDGCTLSYGEVDCLPFYDGCVGIKVTNCEISWAGNAIYNISDTNNAPSYCVFSGNTIHDIGVRPSMQNGDAHGIGIQSGHDNIIEDNYFYNCGTTICLYAFTNQELKNTIIRRNFVKNSHQLGGNPGYGITLQCDNASLSDKSGNKIYQNIVVNCSVGIRVQYEDQVEIYNNVISGCGTSFYSGRSYNNYGPNVKARNNISLNPSSYHVYFATSGANSVCDYNYNLYYPDGGSKFYYNSGTYNFSGWKSLTRAGYTFDPNSTFTAPLFQSPANENFQLQSSSPAIDAGVFVGLSQDRQGTPIPQGFAPDIGAYECKKTIYPRISATPSSGPPPLAINFSAEATGDFPPFTYKWDFGDGQSSNSQYCSHTYTNVGTYVSILTVTDSRGNRESQSIEIQAYRMYRLSLAMNTGSPAPGAGGTTNPAPGDYSYVKGSTVQLSAVPHINYRFSQWAGDIAFSESFKQNTAVIIDRDKMATANFCAKCGDVNGDLAITPADAQAAFDIFLGKIPNPTACQKENADVNADGTKTSPRITPLDAQLIFNKYLERSDLPSDCAGKSRTSLAISSHPGGSATLSYTLGDLEKKIGEDIFLSVIVAQDSNISSFGFDLQFPPYKLEPIGLEKTKLTESFSQVGFHEISRGLLRVGGYKANRKQDSSPGVSLIIIFRIIKPPIKADEFRIAATYDEIRSDSIRTGSIRKKAKEERTPVKKYPARTKGKKWNYDGFCHSP